VSGKVPLRRNKCADWRISMKLNVFVSATALAVSACLLLTAVPASAAPQPHAPALTAEVEQRAEALFAGVDDSHRTFDGAAARSAGASAADVDDFGVGYLAGGGQVRNVHVESEDVEALRAVAGQARCVGRNSADVTGVQANLYLNSCNTNKLVALLAGAAGFATIVGLITAATGAGGLAGGIAAGALAIGSAAIAYCGSKGRGIGFHVLPVGPPWCASQ
jgi:hypothetical protein